MKAQNLGSGFLAPNSSALRPGKRSQHGFYIRVSFDRRSGRQWGSQKSHNTSSSIVSWAINHSKPQLVGSKGLVATSALNTDIVDTGMSTGRKKLAVFVSGGGSNFRAIHEAVLAGSVQGDVVVLVTNKSGCGGANYARERGIPVIMYPKTKGEPEEGLTPDQLVATLRRFKVDYVLLAGYLKLIPIELVQAYPKRIVNIHPSLLPAFGGKGYYGMKVHKAVIASGVRYSGPTIHFVDEEYDTGRILAQRVVPVLAHDTPEELAGRVLHQEHRLYVEVVEALCEDRVVFRDDGVPVIRSREDPNKYT